MSSLSSFGWLSVGKYLGAKSTEPRSDVAGVDVVQYDEDRVIYRARLSAPVANEIYEELSAHGKTLRHTARDSRGER